MKPLSSLSLPSDNLDDLLVKGIYDGMVEIEDGEGKIQSYFVKRFGQHDVLFDEDGIAYLHQSAIAALLGLSRKTVNQTLQNLAQNGFITTDSRYVRQIRTYLSDGIRQRELFVYSAYVINLVAARMKKPTDQALAFLRFREDIFEAHQKTMHTQRMQLAEHLKISLVHLQDVTERLDATRVALQESENQKRHLENYADTLKHELDEAVNDHILDDLENRYGDAAEWD